MVSHKHKAQNVNSRPRTKDIALTEDIDFKSMMFPEPILKGLLKSGYRRPSPIQHQALPLVRCGFDLIVQAKAGTGKTLVLAIAALEAVMSGPGDNKLCAIVLAPTREIAAQTCNVINAVGRYCEGLKCECFVGGRPLSEDAARVAGCRVAVGAPGRVSHLLRDGLLDASHVRLFVLDEADKLVEEAFTGDIDHIFGHLPVSKQVLALSATYAPKVTARLRGYTRDGGRHCAPDAPSPNEVTSTLANSVASGCVLLGVRQLVAVLPDHANKLARLRMRDKCLLQLLGSVPFDQCMVFTNLHSRAESTCGLVRRADGPAADWISGRQPQERREQAMRRLRDQRVRVLCATDLTARGVDVEHVNLVINLDAPRDPHTYLHRMGRAGRFGAYGLVITIVHSGQGLEAFRRMIGKIGGASMSVSLLPSNLQNTDLWGVATKDLEQIHGIVDPGDRSESEDAMEPQSDSSDASESDVMDQLSGTKIGILDDGSNVISSESDVKDQLNGTKLGNLDDGSNVISSESKLSEDSDLVKKPKCECGIAGASVQDVDKVFRSSLFCVAEREEGWHDISSTTINESMIPLSTPFTLLGSKVIRVKSSSGKPFEEDFCSSDDSSDTVIQFDRSNHNKKTSFLTYDEIKSALESGSYIENSLKVGEKDVLDYKTVVTLLDDKSENCEQNQSCADKVCSILSKFKRKQKLVENRLKCFDSFDLAGWMTADESLNIKNSIDIKNCDIYRFDIITCPGGVMHVKPTDQKNTKVNEKMLNDKMQRLVIIENKTENIEVSGNDPCIMALNLKHFHLDQTDSLKQIAAKVVLKEIFLSEVEKTDLIKEAYISKQLNNVEISLSNNKISNDDSSSELITSEKDNGRLDRPRSTSKQNRTSSKKKISTYGLNGESNTMSLIDKQNSYHKLHPQRCIEENAIEESNSRSDLKSCKGKKNNRKKTSVALRLNQNHQNNTDHPSKSSRTTHTSASIKERNDRTTNVHFSRSSESDSGKSVHNERTWNDLHDCNESDSGPSDDVPCTPSVNKKVNKNQSSSSESSSVSDEDSVSDDGKNATDASKRQWLQGRFREWFGKTSSTPQVDSQASEHYGDSVQGVYHSCQTFDKGIGTNGDPKREWFQNRFREWFGPTSNHLEEAHSKKYSDSHKSHPQTGHPSPQISNNPYCFHQPTSSYEMPQTEPDPSFPTYRISGRGDSHNSYHQGPTRHRLKSFSSGNSSYNILPGNVLQSYNLAHDWYQTWYLKVRQRAFEIQYIEYMRMMCSRDS